MHDTVHTEESPSPRAAHSAQQDTRAAQRAAAIIYILYHIHIYIFIKIPSPRYLLGTCVVVAVGTLIVRPSPKRDRLLEPSHAAIIKAWTFCPHGLNLNADKSLFSQPGNQAICTRWKQKDGPKSVFSSSPRQTGLCVVQIHTDLENSWWHLPGPKPSSSDQR